LVKGLDIFRIFFVDHSQNYILIGGAACSELFSEEGLTFRATRDLDIILVVEALDGNFLSHFWEFIRKGEYRDQLESQGQRKYYRFQRPEDPTYPEQIELFSRNPNLLDLAVNTHLTPIPADEEISSLSAILMDDSYYHFTLDNSVIIEGLHLASPIALICLKAKAFLDMKMQASQGRVDTKNIKKHKNDIIRLVILLRNDSPVTLPYQIKEDMINFTNHLEEEKPDITGILKNLGIPPKSITIETIIDQLIKSFDLRTH